MGLESASTVVSGLSARSVVGAQSASTVVCALTARSAVGGQSASTVVSALIARSAMGVQSASTVVSALGARSAVVHQSASTVEYVQGARSVAPRINESRDECASSSSPAPSLTSRALSNKTALTRKQPARLPFLTRKSTPALSYPLLSSPLLPANRPSYDIRLRSPPTALTTRRPTPANPLRHHRLVLSEQHRGVVPAEAE